MLPDGHRAGWWARDILANCISANVSACGGIFISSVDLAAAPAAAVAPERHQPPMQGHEFPLVAVRLLPNRQDLLGRGDVESLGERGRHWHAEHFHDDVSPGFQHVTRVKQTPADRGASKPLRQPPGLDHVRHLPGLLL
jgi:hypothetical protein